MKQHQILLSLDRQSDTYLKNYLECIGTHNTYFLPRVITCFFDICKYDDKTIFELLNDYLNTCDYSDYYNRGDLYKVKYHYFEYGYLDNDLYRFSRQIYNSEYNHWFGNYMQFLSTIVMYVIASDYAMSKVLNYNYEFEQPEDRKINNVIN